MACVLIVDDNETLREGARAILKKMGHTCVVCKSGEEGIAAFGGRPCDMVLTDLKMEGKEPDSELSRKFEYVTYESERFSVAFEERCNSQGATDR